MNQPRNDPRHPGRKERGRPDADPAPGGPEDLDRLLEQAGDDESGTEGESSTDEALEGLDQEEINRLLGTDDAGESGTDEEFGKDDEPDADESPEDIDQGEVAALMDDAYGAGQELGRLGDSALMVAEDRLSAFFRGPVPPGTTYDKVVKFLKEAGISFGVLPGSIYDLLPQKKTRRQRQRRASATVAAGQRDVVVAQGQPPVPPGEARLEYLFEETSATDVKTVQQALEGPSLARLQKAPTPLPLVRPGQVLARLAQDPGKPGRDVFGKKIPAPPPAEGALKIGENVARADEGQTCVAEICGYAVVLDEAITVLSPMWISRNLMQAFFVFLPQNGAFQPPTVADLKAILQHHAVAHGIDEQAMATLCKNLEKGGEVDCCTLIARGADAVPGEPAHWQFSFNPKLTRYFIQIERVFNKSRRVASLVGDFQGLAGKPVNAGEELAIHKPATEGKMGRDVFGEEFMPDEEKEVRLEPGDHVELSEDGARLVAGIYGYVGVGKDDVSMVSPVWVAPDQSAAYFVNLPQLGEKKVPSYEEIDTLLELAGIRFGIDHRAIGVLCEKMEQGLPTDLAVPIARRQKPRAGVAGQFEFAVDVEPKSGLFLEDGSIDFKQLNLAPLLAADQLIGTCIPAEEGKAGRDVAGRELPVPERQDIVVDVGKNVRLVREEGQPDRYVTEIDGELAWMDRREQTPPVIHLAVHQTKTVPGDVDYHTGNIDYPGNVHVQGSIKSGFAVKAEGNVVIGDSVDDGATVSAGGNVAVKHGIAGEQTRIAALGSVFAKFINAARVRAKDEVIVSEYIHNASVKADDSISVLGSSKSKTSGGIAGGFVLAGRQIQAQSIGTQSAETTSLVAGVDPALLQQVTDLKKQISQYQTVISKILRALEVESLDPAKIKGILFNLLLKAKGPRRKVLAGAAKNLLELQARCEKARARKKELDQQAEEVALGGEIAVSGAVAVNTVVRIGEHSRVIKEDTAAIVDVKFLLGKEKDGKIQLRMTTN